MLFFWILIQNSDDLSAFLTTTNLWEAEMSLLKVNQVLT